MAVLFRVFLTISSLCLIFAVFLASLKFNLLAQLHSTLEQMPDMASYVFYFLCAVLIARISIYFTSFLENDVIPEDSFSIIESANDSYLPIYLGYFFVALSIQDYTVFIFVFGIIYIFTFYSQVTYFNPMFFLFGYRFYYAINKNNIKILLITRRHLKNPAAASFQNVKRINDFTFIDIEEGK